MASQTKIKINHSADSSPKERIQTTLDYFRNDPDYHGFDSEGLKGVECVAANAEKQTAEFILTVTPHLCNKNDILHGGAACMLLDMLTTSIMSMLQRPGYLDSGHVSRALSLTYLRPAPLGAKVKVECHANSISKRMANLTGVIKTMDGKKCVVCIHDRVVFEAPKL